MIVDPATGFAGLVRDLVGFARAVSPDLLVERIGAHVLVGPAAASPGIEHDAGDAWSFETKVTGGAPTPPPMLRGPFEQHEVYTLRKSRAGFFPNVIMVGRAASNDIVLDDASLSKLHARLKPLSQDRFLVTDAGSTYGTFVGATRLAKNEEAEVTHGDHIRFGDRPFKLFDTARLHTVLVRTVLLPE